MLPLSPIEKLRLAHDTGPFDCGKEELNRFLKRFALINQQANSAQTYVVCRGSVVIGYYSLSVGGVAHEDTPERVGKGLARYLIPVIILARLAVDKREQSKGIGKGLLKVRCNGLPKLQRSPVSEQCLCMPKMRKQAPSTSASTLNLVRPIPIIYSCW
jgi:hypothetical protein